MRRLVPITVATAIVLASLGVVLVGGKSTVPTYGLASTSPITTGAVEPSAAIDARRAAIEQRIEAARRAGQLRGVGYMAILGEQQSVLVAQRRAEAQGMTATSVRDLNAALDRIDADLDRALHR